MHFWCGKPWLVIYRPSLTSQTMLCPQSPVAFSIPVPHTGSNQCWEKCRVWLATIVVTLYQELMKCGTALWAAHKFMLILIQLPPFLCIGCFLRYRWCPMKLWPPNWKWFGDSKDAYSCSSIHVAGGNKRCSEEGEEEEEHPAKKSKLEDVGKKHNLRIRYSVSLSTAESLRL